MSKPSILGIDINFYSSSKLQTTINPPFFPCRICIAIDCMTSPFMLCTSNLVSLLYIKWMQPKFVFSVCRAPRTSDVHFIVFCVFQRCHLIPRLMLRICLNICCTQFCIIKPTLHCVRLSARMEVLPGRFMLQNKTCLWHIFWWLCARDPVQLNRVVSNYLHGKY